jgi:hypothetical protein
MSSGRHHVWVRPEHLPTEVPGLVLEWRRNGPDWEALVTYASRAGMRSQSGCRLSGCGRSG